MQLRLDQYNDNTTGIREAIVSLVSCRDNEIDNESHILRRVLHTHRNDTMLRRNATAILRREQMVARAEQVLVQRAERQAAALVGAVQQHLQDGGTAKSLLQRMGG